MIIVPLDAGWVGVAGAVCTLIGALAAPVIVHRLGKEGVERSLKGNRDGATIQHAREVARQLRKERLDAFIEFLGDEEQLFLAIMHGATGLVIAPLESASLRSFMRVRLLAGDEVQPKILALWNSTTSFTAASLEASQLPTKEAKTKALEQPIEVHTETLFQCMATMTATLEDIVAARELGRRLRNSASP